MLGDGDEFDVGLGAGVGLEVAWTKEPSRYWMVHRYGAFFGQPRTHLPRASSRCRSGTVATP